MIISLLHKRDRTSVSDEMLIISLSHERVRTSVADDTFFGYVCRHVHNVYYRMNIFNASTYNRYKNIPIIFYCTQHHLVEMNKRPAQFGYRKSGIQAGVLSHHSRIVTVKCIRHRKKV